VSHAAERQTALLYPATIDALVAELGRIETELQAFVAPFNDVQGNWQPERGRRWSLTQNLQHLAKTNEVYVRAMRAGLKSGRAPASSDENLAGVPGIFGRWFISTMEPPPRFRVKTRNIVQPPSTGSLREALQAFLASHDVVRAFAREASGNLRARFTSPFGPMRFRVGTGLLVLAAHDRRHLWQMRQVVKADGFGAERV
jgi:hypothetical protein